MFYEINNPEVILIGGAAVCIAITDVILAHISFNYSNNGFFIFFFATTTMMMAILLGGGKGCAQPPSTRSYSRYHLCPPRPSPFLPAE